MQYLFVKIVILIPALCSICYHSLKSKYHLENEQVAKEDRRKVRMVKFGWKGRMGRKVS